MKYPSGSEKAAIIFSKVSPDSSFGNAASAPNGFVMDGASAKDETAGDVRVRRGPKSSDSSNRKTASTARIVKRDAATIHARCFMVTSPVATKYHIEDAACLIPVTLDSIFYVLQ